jgi:hypothetical protein
MAEENNTQQTTTTPDGGEATFTQAQVDALIAREKAKATAKATKGLPSEEELTAFRNWQTTQQNNTSTVNTLTRERDTATAQLQEANNKLTQLERERLLIDKGIPAEDVDYYVFKISKNVTDKVTFEQAAEEFLKDKKPGTVRVDFTAPAGGNNGTPTTNQTMNSILRGAIR